MGVFASLKYIKLNVGLYNSMRNWYSIGTVKTTKKKTVQHNLIRTAREGLASSRAVCVYICKFETVSKR